MQSALRKAATIRGLWRTLNRVELPGRLRNERGVALPLIGVAMIAIIGLAAVGIDTGRVAGVANEAQTAADIAALAGLYAVNEDNTAASGAEAALDENRVNGGMATASLTTIEEGYISPEYVFTAGGEPTNAVRAVVGATIDNILLGAIGAPQSTVTREAIATLSGLGSGIPTLPVVIGDCHFQADCDNQNCMPIIEQVPDHDDNTAWTGFFTSGSTNDVIDYAPGTDGCNGGGTEQFIRVGDYINIANGQNVPILQAIVCYVQATGVDIFTIPIVECGHAYNQPQLVVGFAKIKIENATSTGANKGFTLQGIWEAPRPGPPGGGEFGLSAIALVK
jgi:hypothetical protein